MTRRWVWFAALTLAVSLSAFAADEGGKVSGKVAFTGAATERVAITPKIDAEVCGAKDPILLESLLVQDGGLANAVVVLSGKGLGSGPSQGGSTASLKARNCTFVPHVQAVWEGTSLEIENEDPIIHNVHAFQGKKTLFNLGMPLKGKKVRRALKNTGVIGFRADSGHTWMRAYVVVLPHSYFAVTDEKGAFSIENVPPGSYRLKVWHEKLGERQVDVKVEASKEATANVSYGSETAGDKPTETQQLQARFQEVETSLRGELEKTKASVDTLVASVKAERRARILGEGRSLFLKHCATCHGEKGDGLGPSAKFLSYPPRNFLNGDYQFRMTPSGTLAREEDVFRTITLGVLGTPMPPWKAVLSYEQRRLLSQYVMQLSPRFNDEGSGVAIEIPEAPPSSQAAIARGAELYTQMQCQQCHGPEGRGDGPSGGTMMDDWGNPIRAWDFTRGYFQGGKGAEVVYRTISTGLSGSPMPSFAEMLEPAQRWDLSHFVMSLGKKRNVADYLFRDPAGRTQVP